MRRPTLFALTFALLVPGCWNFDALLPGSVDMPFVPPEMDLATPDLQCSPNPQAEDCSNGIDDNGNCLTDCDDPECATNSACKVQNYGTLQTAQGTAALACASGVLVGKEFYQGIDANQKGCTGCDCNSPDCSTVAKASVFTAANCPGNSVKDYSNLKTGTCTALNPAVPANGNNFTYDVPKPVCAPKAASGVVTPAYAQRAQLCQPNGSPMCTTLACAMAVATPKLCVQLGSDAKHCPSPFTQRVTSWQTTYNDVRTCACSCSAGNGTCTGAVTAYGAANCTDPANIPSVALKTDGTCTGSVLVNNANPMMPVAAPALALRSTYAPAAGTACAPTGTVSGAAPTVSGALVLCCKP